nr:OmpA family protein [Desulfobulbaceae bacterium]
MKNPKTRFLSALLISLLLTSCAMLSSQPEPSFTPINLNDKVSSGEYQKKTDNFLLLFDASSSMFLDYNQEMKFKQAKRIANRMNQTIPDLDLQSGLGVFGPTAIGRGNGSKLSYGMTSYNRKAFGDALQQVSSPSGNTPMTQAIKLAGSNLAESKGKIAVILISDAEDVGNPPLAAATELKATYGDRICVYTVLIGNNSTGKATMTQIANATQCGFATDYASIESPQGMADFVERIFLEKATDSDGDGVFDSMDQCPGTPKGTPVDAVGCPIKKADDDKDSDGDGVYDSKDQCPGTPYGIKVDQYGCPLPIEGSVTIELRVEFDFDKDTVRPQYRQELQDFADFLTSYPNLTVTLEGHTDNYGSKEYNEELSIRRAKSVRRYLVGEFGLWGNRITTTGYGFSRPEADNTTSQGRQKNRRVYAIIQSN